MSSRSFYEEQCRKEWGDLVTKLQNDNRDLREKVKDLEQRRWRLVSQFEALIQKSGLKVGNSVYAEDLSEEELAELMPALEKEIQDRLTQAYHFDVMMKAVQSNSTVESTWKQFMMTLRLCGFDKKEEHS